MPYWGARLAMVALSASAAATGQKVISAKAGLIYFVEGEVSIEGNGGLGSRSRLGMGEKTRQLNIGETLVSERGRAEVLLNPGTVLRIGDLSRIRMDSVDLTDTRVTLEGGSAVIAVNNPPKLDRVEIHAGSGAVALKGDGVYRLDAEGPGASAPRVRVYAGQIEVSGAGGATVVANRGQVVGLDDLQRSEFDTRDADGLQLWADSRSTTPFAKPAEWISPGYPTRGRGPRSLLPDPIFASERAKTPFDLVRFVNGHASFEWDAMGDVPGAAGDFLDDCAAPSHDCAAELVDVPDLREQIVVLRRGFPPPAFLRYRKTGQGGTAWEFAGAYGAGTDLEPEYQVTKHGAKTYFEITRRGLTESGIDIQTQDWIDLSSAKFEPAFSLITSSRFTEQREYETNASIVSWEAEPVETLQVRYMALAMQDGKILGMRTADATFVRRGDKFVFDPSRSTVPEKARWGAFDVDGVRLLFHLPPPPLRPSEP